MIIKNLIFLSFEKLIPQHSRDNISASLDPHQFALRSKQIHRGCHIHCPPHPENNNSYIKMLFHDSSLVFNTISPMKLIGKHSGPEDHTPQLDIGFPHKQTPDSTDWQSHLLYVSVLPSLFRVLWCSYKWLGLNLNWIKPCHALQSAT